MNIAESAQRILTGNDLISKLFYDKYLTRYPEIGWFFLETDMAHQAAMLRMALMMAEQYYRNRYKAMDDYLKVIGYRHKRRGVPTDLYADWRDCMLDTLKEFHGDDWSDALETEWAEAIDLAVSLMLKGYELEDGHV